MQVAEHGNKHSGTVERVRRACNLLRCHSSSIVPKNGVQQRECVQQVVRPVQHVRIICALNAVVRHLRNMRSFASLEQPASN